MDILQRFALIIHWSGLITGVVLGSSYLSIGIIPYLSPDVPLYGRFLLIAVAAFTFLACSGLGWLFRFVISGKIHFLPWKKLND